MNNIQKFMRDNALNIGFAHTAFLPVRKLVFVEKYRIYCEENVCGNYNKLPNCPPKCGTVQEMRERAGQFTTALIMQSVWDLEDYGDTKAIKAMKGRHNLMTRELTDKVKEQGITGLTMSAGPTAQDCCMSAYCVDAARMAADCGMVYWMPEGKISFFSQFLFNE
ncbi:MAG: DUF2284 domain-containing protein [Lachnospiraceae bacterium]|nr:DUF2284 domain-containing protein [Lachnospiraceae bacterium]